MKDFMKINENDNVIVALKEMKKGEKEKNGIRK